MPSRLLACVSTVVMAAASVSASPTFASGSTRLEATTRSANWSGYQVNSGAGVRTVRGRWQVPSPGRTPPGASAVYSSVWVGMGGGKGSALVQAGSESDAFCRLVLGVCSSRSTRTFLWYEIYPDVVVLPISSVGAAVGDTVSVTIAFRAGIGTFKLCNDSRRQCATVQRRASVPPNAQAEWIVERPTENGRVAPLADFAGVTIAHPQYTDLNGVAHSPYGGIAIDMYSCRGAQLAQTGAYSRLHATFGVTWVGFGSFGC